MPQLPTSLQKHLRKEVKGLPFKISQMNLLRKNMAWLQCHNLSFGYNVLYCSTAAGSADQWDNAQIDIHTRRRAQFKLNKAFLLRSKSSTKYNIKGEQEQELQYMDIILVITCKFNTLFSYLPQPPTLGGPNFTSHRQITAQRPLSSQNTVANVSALSGWMDLKFLLSARHALDNWPL